MKLIVSISILRINILVKAGLKSVDIRYILAGGGNGGRDNPNCESIIWVKRIGKLISYSSADSTE